MPAADSCEYIFVSSGTDEALGIAQDYAERFLTAYGPRARVISFYGPMRTACFGKEQFLFWTDLLSAEDHVRMRDDAARRLDRLAEHCSEDVAPVFGAFRCLLHDEMFSVLAVFKFLQDEEHPTALIMRGSGAIGPVASIKRPRALGLPKEGFRSTYLPAGSPGAKAMTLCGKAKKPVAGSTEKRAVHLLAANEGGNRVSRDAILAICKDLKQKNVDLLVLTLSPAMSSAMKEADMAVRLIESRSLTSDEIATFHQRIGYNVRYLAGVTGVDAVDLAFLSKIENDLLSWARDVLVINEALDRIDDEFNVVTVLTVGLAEPLSILAGERYQQNGATWQTYHPILLRPSIDIASSKHRVFYRQADRYLAYGDHLRDQLLAVGIPPDAITVVGSTDYDRSRRRNLQADRDHVKKQILKHWNEADKLVIVATECSPRPFEEIDPIVRNLTTRDGVHTVIKVHPNDSFETYLHYAESLGVGTKLEVVKDCDVNALIHAADLLIAIFSNVIITSAVLGTPVLVCDFADKRAPLDFVAEGLSLGCFDPRDLPRILDGLLRESDLLETAKALIRDNIHRFNGPNDGQSAARVAQKLMEPSLTAKPSSSRARRASLRRFMDILAASGIARRT